MPESRSRAGTRGSGLSTVSESLIVSPRGPRKLKRAMNTLSSSQLLMRIYCKSTRTSMISSRKKKPTLSSRWDASRALASLRGEDRQAGCCDLGCGPSHPPSSIPGVLRLIYYLCDLDFIDRPKKRNNLKLLRAFSLLSQDTQPARELRNSYDIYHTDSRDNQLDNHMIGGAPSIRSSESWPFRLITRHLPYRQSSHGRPGGGRIGNCSGWLHSIIAGVSPLGSLSWGRWARIGRAQRIMLRPLCPPSSIFSNFLLLVKRDFINRYLMAYSPGLAGQRGLVGLDSGPYL